MNSQLPKDIGGLQALEDHVEIQDGDVWVEHGKPTVWLCRSGVLKTVGELRLTLADSSIIGNVYRKMPVPKQGGLDHEQPKLQVWEMAEIALRDIEAKAKSGLPSDAKARKDIPITAGFLHYFPLAVAAVAELSRIGNDQHNPGKPLHWDRSKSGDELDALGRHLLECGTVDKDGVLHDTKVAWRAMANLQKVLEGKRS